MGALTGAVQWLGDAFNNAGQTIQSSIQGAVDFVMGALQGLWNYIMTLGGLIPENASITGNGVIDAILKVMAFIATLPAQIGMFLINTIAQALGFGDNFTQTMIQGAADAVSGFLEWIGQLPGRSEQYCHMVNIIMAIHYRNHITNRRSISIPIRKHRNDSL